jgi:hypothetical protein
MTCTLLVTLHVYYNFQIVLLNESQKCRMCLCKNEAGKSISVHQVYHSPTFNIQNECVNLNLKMCQSNEQCGMKRAEHSVGPKIWNKNGQLLNTFIYSTLCLRHTYILYTMSYLCPEISVSSFICKIIGHLFIARGCDTKTM